MPVFLTDEARKKIRSLRRRILRGEVSPKSRKNTNVWRKNTARNQLYRAYAASQGLYNLFDDNENNLLLQYGPTKLSKSKSRSKSPRF
jgi:hypothetical protein